MILVLLFANSVCPFCVLFEDVNVSKPLKSSNIRAKKTIECFYIVGGDNGLQKNCPKKNGNASF